VSSSFFFLSFPSNSPKYPLPQRCPAKKRSLFHPESNEENTTDAENSDHHNSSPSQNSPIVHSSALQKPTPAKKHSLFTPESDKENTSPSHKRSCHDLDWNTTKKKILKIFKIFSRPMEYTPPAINDHSLNSIVVFHSIRQGL
jgi:hypothetical protein